MYILILLTLINSTRRIAYLVESKMGPDDVVKFLSVGFSHWKKRQFPSSVLPFGHA